MHRLNYQTRILNLPINAQRVAAGSPARLLQLHSTASSSASSSPFGCRILALSKNANACLLAGHAMIMWRNAQDAQVAIACPRLKRKSTKQNPRNEQLHAQTNGPRESTYMYVLPTRQNHAASMKKNRAAGTAAHSVSSSESTSG